MTPEQTVVFIQILDQHTVLGFNDETSMVLDLGEGAKVEIRADGSQSWFLNGQQHRTDGPAVIWANGSQSWWLNGQQHRTDGPAEIYADGSQRWFLNGERMTQTKHTAAVRKLRAA